VMAGAAKGKTAKAEAVEAAPIEAEAPKA
jgi:hypothetical protein